MSVPKEWYETIEHQIKASANETWVSDCSTRAAISRVSQLVTLIPVLNRSLFHRLQKATSTSTAFNNNINIALYRWVLSKFLLHTAWITILFWVHPQSLRWSETSVMDISFKNSYFYFSFSQAELCKTFSEANRTLSFNKNMQGEIYSRTIKITTMKPQFTILLTWNPKILYRFSRGYMDPQGPYTHRLSTMCCVAFVICISR